MVKCDQENLDTLQDMFLTLHENGTIKFFAWKEFKSLNDIIRDTAFLRVFNFNRYYRSVTINGLKDNEDNILMKYRIKQSGQAGSDKDPDPLETILVSDYINTIKAGNNTNLFAHVYEPIGGVRDTIVHIDNFTEAKEFALIALIELYLNMNTASRLLVFLDPKTVEYAMSTKPKWKPFTRAAELIVE
jgi:hypothetical protein